jgi:hypothetical protein
MIYVEEGTKPEGIKKQKREVEIRRYRNYRTLMGREVKINTQ